MVEKGWAKRSRCLHLTFISPIVGFVAAPVRKRFCGDNNKNNRGLIFFVMFSISLYEANITKRRVKQNVY